MPKGVEGKKGKGKAPCGRGHGRMRDNNGGCSFHGCGRQVMPGDRSPPNLAKWVVLPRASDNRSGQCRICKVPLICTKGGKVYFLI